MRILNWFTARAVERAAPTDRVVVDGVDITYWRMSKPGDQPLRAPAYSLREPLAYGPSRLTLPRFNAQLETLPTWARKGATVKYQRVYPDGTKVTDYVGRVLALRVDGTSLALEIGGFLEGPANLVYKTPPVYRTLVDIGHHMQLALQVLNAPMVPTLGPDTSFEMPQDGGMSLLAWMAMLGSLATNRTGLQRTVMPTTWGVNEWAFDYKDTTTVDATLFHDGERVSVDVVDDAAEQPNVWYASGVNPEGGRWRNAKAPGVTGTQGPPPPYPMADESPLTVGMTDADTDTGDGIDVLRVNLQLFGYLAGDYIYEGVYDAEIAAAVQDLRAEAGLPPSDSTSINVWNALFDIDTTGYSVADARQFPVSQDNDVMKWRYTPSGHRRERNDSYDPGKLRVDRPVDFGPGVHLNEGAAWCRAQRLRLATGSNWAGTIRLNGMGGFSGQHADDSTTSAALIMAPRDFRPGMNVWLPHFDGGTLFHVSGIDVDGTTATLTVDTKARDFPELSQILARNREGRRDIRREWRAENRQSIRSTDIPGWDADLGGKLFRDVALVGGQWNWVAIPTGQAGQINLVNLHTAVTSGDEAEFAVAVCSRQLDLAGTIGDPMSVDANDEPKWVTNDTIVGWYESGAILYSAGHELQPCGYGARRKYATGSTSADLNRTTAPLTGDYVDSATWPYLQDPYEPTILWLAIWPTKNTTLAAGTVFRHQMTDY